MFRLSDYIAQITIYLSASLRHQMLHELDAITSQDESDCEMEAMLRPLALKDWTARAVVAHWGFAGQALKQTHHSFFEVRKPIMKDH